MPPKYKIFYLILFFLGLFSTAISAATDSHESTSGISRHDIEAYHAYLSTRYAPSAESVGKERKRRKDKKSELADSTATVDTALQTTGPLRQEPVDTATAGSALSRGVLISDTTNRASTPSDSTFSLVADTTGIGLDTTSLAPDTAATDSARAPRKEAFEDVITYHANDSAVFNKDAYLNFLRKIIGKAETRKVVHKEIIIDEASPEEILQQVEQLDAECTRLREKIGDRRQSFFAYWTRGYDRKAIHHLHDEVEKFVEKAQNCRSALLVTKLMDYPILRNLLLYNPCGQKNIGWIVMWLLPLTLPLYLIGNWEQKQLRHELQVIAHTNGEIKNIARQLIDEREKEIEK